MALFKEVWQFKGLNGATWNDTWCCEGNSLADVATYGDAFLDKRLSMLHPFNRLKRIRVSMIDNPRVATSVTINRPGTDDGDGVQINRPANVNEAAVIGLGSTVVPATRKWWLRGMSEASVFRSATDGVGTCVPAFLEKINSFLSTICRADSSYRILKITPVGTGGIVSVGVTRVDGSAADGFSVLTCKANPGVSVDNFVILSQFNKKQFPGLSGAFQVIAQSGLTVTVPYVTPENANLESMTGKLKKRLYMTGVKFNRASCGFEYLGNHDTKNPDTGSRGAKRATRIRKSA